MKKDNFEKLNLCIVSERFPILGRATDHGFLWPIAKGLTNQGHNVVVISGQSPLGKAEVTRDDVRVFYLHDGFPNLSHLPFEDGAFLKFQELHKTQHFHLVHSIDNSGYKIAKHKSEFGVAVAFDVEATHMSQIFATMGMSQQTLSSLLMTSLSVAWQFATKYFGHDRALLKSANGVFVTSPQQRLALERYWLYPDYHTYSVPYGIELGPLIQREKSAELKTSLGLPENAHIVVTINDMTEVFEMRNLLRAFEVVAVKKPNSYMIVVGNGPKWKAIEYEMLTLALGSRVLMVGAIKTSEVPDYIALADIFVNMSARSTGIEPSLIEAMAQKKIVIGSEVSPMANVIEDGVDGFLLRPADSSSLGLLMLEVFNGNIASGELGEKARNKVLNMYDAKKMVMTIIEAYKKILQNG